MLDRLPVDSPPGDAAGPERSAGRGLVFEDYFLGAVRGGGIVQDRLGQLRGAFQVDMQGYWSNADFVVDEFFRFRDGKIQRRTWRMTRGAGGRYQAAAEDVAGLGEGFGDGTMIRWRYRLRVPVGRRRVTFAFDDRMYLMEDGTVLDVSDMSKFGIRCGRLVLALKRRP